MHSEVYNMPIWMRKFHIKSIQKHLKDQEEEIKKQKQKQGQSLSNKITGPNINPSSTYNFKK